MKRLTLILFAVFVFIMIGMWHYQNYRQELQDGKAKILNQLDATGQFDTIDDAFRSHFVEGMDRQSIHEKLIEMDPSLEMDSSNCPEDKVNEICCDGVSPFYDYLQYRYVFCYDRDMRLLYITISS